MEPFFRHFSMLRIDIEDIIPSDATSEAVKARAVYQYYVNTLTQMSVDGELRLYRMKALQGNLLEVDFQQLNEFFNASKRKAIDSSREVVGQTKSEAFHYYAQLNSFAMLIGQILFVDTMVKEGLPLCLEESNFSGVTGALSAYINDIPQKQSKTLHSEDVRFYATLFVLQTTFDKIYVPDENVVTYDITTGAFLVTDRYDQCTGYLALCGKKGIAASEAEQALCYNITTGWCEGIDLATWNDLNTCYYSAISATTGEENLFTKNYDLLLERMIPQFTLSKVKLADDILNLKKVGVPLKILEIGAGSGALAIDLIMAAKRRGLEWGEITYEGVEPSDYMRGNFRSNCERKIGSTVFPESWTLIEGALESVEANPRRYLSGDVSTIIVFSFSLHHCFQGSVQRFFNNAVIKSLAEHVLVMDAVVTHGWQKPYYMWADCESPENFDNILDSGLWSVNTLWCEPPDVTVEGYIRGWCYLQLRT